jgi:hypothetical protein
MYVEKRAYQLIPANSQVNVDYVVPNGQALEVQKMVLNTPTVNAETAVICWDPTGANIILMSCSGNAEGSYAGSFAGDGSKVVRITLINTASIDQYMGAYFTGLQS